MKLDVENERKDFSSGLVKVWNAAVTTAAAAALALAGTCASVQGSWAAPSPSDNAYSKLDQKTVSEIADMMQWQSEAKQKAELEPEQAGFM